MPLVMNLSFGVGNEQRGQGPDRPAGRTRCWRRIPTCRSRSAPATTAPGCRTMGFPGSARSGHHRRRHAARRDSCCRVPRAGAGSRRVLQLPRRRGGQARPGRPRRGVQLGAPVECRRRGEAGHQHGLAPRGGTGGVPGLGAGAGEAAGRCGADQAGAHGDRAPHAGRRIPRRGPRSPRRWMRPGPGSPRRPAAARSPSAAAGGGDAGWRVLGPGAGPERHDALRR